MSEATKNALLPRRVADAYVDALVELDPVLGTYLGLPESSERLPDLSPAGQEARAGLARAPLERLADVTWKSPVIWFSRTR